MVLLSIEISLLNIPSKFLSVDCGARLNFYWLITLCDKFLINKVITKQPTASDNSSVLLSNKTAVVL